LASSAPVPEPTTVVGIVVGWCALTIVMNRNRS
jgi:hypothetical protein